MFKFAIIGSGVVGSMTARALSRFTSDIVVLEKSNDCAMGQSKANSGIVHAGYDPKPGTLKAELNVKGSEMMEEACRDLGVKYRRNQTLVLGFDADDKENLKMLYERGITNGVKDLELIDGDRARELEPKLSQAVDSALWAKTGAIVCPYELTLHALGCAMDNGAEFVRNFEVCGIEDKGDHYVIASGSGETVEAETVINAAGIHSDVIAKLIGDDSFNIVGRKGEYLLLDKEAGELCDMTIFRVPGKMGKGVLASKTVDGNIILGPTSVDITDKENKEVTDEGLKEVIEKEACFFDSIPLDKVITEFTGVRAHGDKDDFIINFPRERFLNLAAIESPGLTSAPAIAEKVVAMLKGENLISEERSDFNPKYEKITDLRQMSLEEKNALIERDPSYGRVVCRCEEVTEGEIIEAIKKNPGARDVDGVKRRTRSGMGRCQGGFCMPVVSEILSRELNIPLSEVSKLGGESEYLTSVTKGAPVVHGAQHEGEFRQEELYDVVIIGGGPAGMAAAVAANEEGAEKVLILEREPKLGGILEQCIHAGFGLQRFKQELTGPEYGERYEEMVKNAHIPSLVNTMVLNITKEDDGHICVTSASKDMGFFDVHAKSIVLAMGCRERTRGALMIPGDRPAGVYTAGTAQKFVNILGFMPGKKVVILGSGDIGLIMARRMTLEGAKVEAVLEIMKDSGGLTRNIVQCLNDFNIPLKLHHTVTKIHGRERVEGVTVSEVDDNLKPIPGTEEYIECDTLMLSCGLIPENELTKKAGASIDPKTKGPVINESKMTDIPGIFAAGNVVKVHELVDYVSEEGALAGRAAAMYAKGEKVDVSIWTKMGRKPQPKGVKNLEGTDENTVICTVCPNGCKITVSGKYGDITEGNMCARGHNFAIHEVANPERTLTSTIVTKEGVPVPVKSAEPIPKAMIMDIVRELEKVEMELPISLGDIIIKDVLNTGVDIVSTRSVNRYEG